MEPAMSAAISAQAKRKSALLKQLTIAYTSKSFNVLREELRFRISYAYGQLLDKTWCVNCLTQGETKLLKEGLLRESFKIWFSWNFTEIMSKTHTITGSFFSQTYQWEVIHFDESLDVLVTSHIQTINTASLHTFVHVYVLNYFISMKLDVCVKEFSYIQIFWSQNTKKCLELSLGWVSDVTADTSKNS